MPNLDEKLEEKLAALVDDRTCDEQGSAFRGGCKECERFSNKGVVSARRFFKDNGAALAASLLRARAAIEAMHRKHFIAQQPHAWAQHRDAVARGAACTVCAVIDDTELSGVLG